MKTEIKFQTVGTRAVVSKKITPEQAAEIMQKNPNITQVDTPAGYFPRDTTDPLRAFRTSLRAGGVKWRRNSAGLLHFYIRKAKPQRMSDGTHWTGTENIGDYENWQEAARCGHLRDHAQKEDAK